MSVSPDTPAGVRPVAPPSRTPPGLLGRMKGMLLSPRGEWELIAAESTPTARLYTGFVVPLALLDALVAFVHVSIVGATDPLAGTVRVPFTDGLITSILVFGCGPLGILVVTWIIGALAPFFGAVRDRQRACAVATYASTPVWLATIFVLFPTVWPPLQLLAIFYHTYLLYSGLRVLVKAPRDRVLGYATTVVLCTILLEIVFAMLSTGLGGATHLNPYRAFG
jgi:Yip1 domain